MLSIVDQRATGDQSTRVRVTPRLDTTTKSGEVEDVDADSHADEDADVIADETRRKRRGGRKGRRSRSRLST